MARPHVLVAVLLCASVFCRFDCRTPSSVRVQHAGSYLSLFQVGVTLNAGTSTLKGLVHETKAVTATFDEEGYQSVVGRRNNVLMSRYVFKLLAQLGGEVLNNETMEGVISFYSGVDASQSFSELVAELQDSIWVDWSHASSEFRRTVATTVAERQAKRQVLLQELAKGGAAPGACASIDRYGFRQVSLLRSDAQMEIFIRRLIAAHGGSLHSTDDLIGFVPFYSGGADGKSFDSLKQELRDAQWVDSFAMTRGLSPQVSAGVSLDENGFASVAMLHSRDEMDLFIRRVAAARGEAITSESDLAEMAGRFAGSGIWSYAALVAELERAPWVSAAGIAVQGQQQERADTALEAASAPAAQVMTALPQSTSSEASVASSGAQTSADASEPLASAESQVRHRLAQPPSVEKFSEAGYRQVVNLRSNGDMGHYIRDLIGQYGGEVSDNEAFRQMVPFHSGAQGSKTFAALLLDLEEASFIAWPTESD
eukprot:TRINITY_DN9276_c0_g1_i1.p1 TRINITY_DN9276_c0_g1~~TRINITY_DN9276_c0_g1_i1.p1  ORF type:complete len:507 (-),score=94.48 TRINITY_DN9276_c0_g1_i1:130-1578(-)